MDEGDADAATDVEELGQVQCRRDVALRREWEEHRVGGWLLSSSRHGRGSVSSCGAKVRFLLLLQCCLLCRTLFPKLLVACDTSDKLLAPCHPKNYPNQTPMSWHTHIKQNH